MKPLRARHLPAPASLFSPLSRSALSETKATMAHAANCENLQGGGRSCPGSFLGTMLEVIPTPLRTSTDPTASRWLWSVAFLGGYKASAEKAAAPSRASVKPSTSRPTIKFELCLGITKLSRPRGTPHRPAPASRKESCH